MTCRILAIAGVLLALGARLAALPEAQREFLRGLTALHNFEYEDANDAFRQTQRIDPGFVMAYWGEAMTYHQTLWRHENVESARRALARWRSVAAARPLNTVAPKDREFLAAVEILFGEGDPMTRRRRYADAMARLYARYSDDPEVASLYALALLGTMSRGLIGAMDATEGHSQGLAGSDTQRQVAAILEKVLASHPGHVGALHYLLHNFDDPERAHLALNAARVYATLAPASSHARHMPSHIFLQLGMWNDAASSDRAAFAYSDAWVKRKGAPQTLRNYHALAWLSYELLQLGRYQEAWKTIGELEPVVKASGDVTLLSDLSSMRARYVIETRRWDLMAREQNFANVNDLFAIGASAAHAGNADLAERARSALADHSRLELEGDLRPAIAIMERELAALIELAAGGRDRAVEILQAAAQAELQLPAPFGLPEPIKPAPELLGEVLLEMRRPHEAVEPFERALQRNANRSLSVLGLARAQAALGRADAALRRYRELLANFDHADADLPELKEARAALDRSSVSKHQPQTIIPLLGGVGGVVIAALVFRRLSTRRRARAASPQRTR